MALRGLPPFLPFSRAARVLIADFTAPPIWPPRRPNATACGFLRFMRDVRERPAYPKALWVFNHPSLAGDHEASFGWQGRPHELAQIVVAHREDLEALWSSRRAKR